MFEKFLELIFPPACGFCGKISEDYLCPDCEKRISKSINISIEKSENSTKYFDEKVSIFPYGGEIRERILDYKFKRKVVFIQDIC